MKPVYRLRILIVLSLAIGGWCASRYVHSDNVFVPYDSIEYWSAAKILVEGGNPYDPAQMYEIQKEQRLTLDKAVMFWNPPWALALIAPLGFFSFKVAVLLWMAGIIISFFASSYFISSLWQKPSPLWLPLIFAPTYFLLAWGQYTGLILLGLALYLFWMKRERPWLAGIAFSLTAIKPHLLLLVGLATALGAIGSSSYRKVILTSLMTLLVFLMISIIFRLSIWSDYRTALALDASEHHDTLKDWQNPTFSYWLRMTIAPDRFWVQFLPITVAGLAMVVALILGRWKPNQEGIPFQVLLSVILAPYGAWPFDLVLLIIPLLQVAAFWPKLPNAPWRFCFLGIFLILQFATLLKPHWFLMEFVWYPLSLFGLYGAIRLKTGK